MRTHTVLFRVARHNGRDYPCIFVADFPVNRGRIVCFDHEGMNEADLAYYYKTRPAKSETEKSACEKLAHAFDCMGEPTNHKLAQRMPTAMLHKHWK